MTSLTKSNGKLLAGGGFTTDGNSSEGFLAAWNGSDWTNLITGSWKRDIPIPWDQSYNIHVWALAASDDQIFVAGNFSEIAHVPSFGFSIWHEGPAPVIAASVLNGQVVLSWSGEFGNALLEMGESLASDQWKAVPNLSAVTDADGNLRTTVTPTKSREFYRLRWQ